MATGSSPVIIELSSDSESGFGTAADSETNWEQYSSQREDDVFVVDWNDNDDYLPIDYGSMDSQDKDDTTDKDKNESISSNDTIIYTPETENMIIDFEKTPEKITQSCKPIEVSKSNIAMSQKELKEQKKLKVLEEKRLRQERKAEELKQKRLKAAIAQKQKYLKPEENIKLLTVNIDTCIVNSNYGGTVITTLQQVGINYTVQNQLKPFTVTWTKKLTDVLVSDQGIQTEDVGLKEENQLIYIMDAESVVKLVNESELLAHVETIKSICFDKSILLVVVGMEKYFKCQKTKFKQGNQVNKNGGKRQLTRNTTEGDHVIITKEELQCSLIELQLFGKCNHCLIESAEELSSLIVTTTKSLSQLDYKLEKQKREEGELEWYAKADSKHCVKIDKTGNGLLKLWQQQICQFNAVGLEMATAIVSNFESPLTLVESYEKCKTKSEAELLLQNIQTRRNAGILSSTRRIGPEVSKKLYNFYTTRNPDLVL